MRRKIRNIDFIIQIILIFIISIEIFRIIQLNFIQNPNAISIQVNKCIINLLVNKTKKETQELSINSKNLGLFLYYPQTFPCPYYNDREDLIIPEVNRIAQYLRSIGSTVIFKTNFTQNVDIKQNFEIINQNDEWESFLNVSLNLTENYCLFSKFTKKPLDSDESIHKNILVSSSSDIFLNNFQDLVFYCIDKKITHILLAGMHSNKWMPLLLQQLIKNNIIPIVIDDIIDVKYSYLSQYSIFPTHNDAIQNFISFILSKNILIINHFDILCQFFTNKCKTTKISYDIHTNSSHFFPYYQ